MPGNGQIIEADLTWYEGALQPGIRVAVEADGRISAVGPRVAPGGSPETRRLTRAALLPGFVNVHSHAFQRGLRGLGEEYAGGHGTFWSWRDYMYHFVQTLTPQRLDDVCRTAFREMLRAGFTTVGEFHYLHHHDPATRDYVYDNVVIRAARDVGIRLVLIQSAYETGGFSTPLEAGQRHFDTHSVAEYTQQLERVAEQLDPRTQSLAVAAHSVRAVPGPNFEAFRKLASERGLPFHGHFEEQRQEIDACRRATGRSPLEWALEHLAIGPDCCAVHATHTPAETLLPWLHSGARICLCPLTEGSLADGVAEVPTMIERPDAVCIGTDCNARIDPIEELRWLEYVQRLERERRGICVGEERAVAPQLLRCGTENGAAALGIPAGRIEAGRLADFCLIDLDAEDLALAEPVDVLTALFVGADKHAVRAVCVGGVWHETRR